MPGHVHAATALMPPTTRKARISASSIARLGGADRPSHVSASEPSRRDTYDGSDPHGEGGGIVDTGVDTGVDTPPSTDRASGQKGGVAPVQSLPAGAARAVRSSSKSTSKTSGKGRGVCRHSAPQFVDTPPHVRVYKTLPLRPALHTGRNMRSALAQQVGSGEPETRPDLETVNRAVRGRFGGCAFGKLPQCFESFHGCAEST